MHPGEGRGPGAEGLTKKVMRAGLRPPWALAFAGVRHFGGSFSRK